MSKEYQMNIEQFPNELKLILFLLNNQMDKHVLEANSKWFMNTNWSLFLELTQHHRVTPLIYLKVKKIDQKYIPLFVVQTLFQEYQKNIFKMLHFSGEAEIISETFSKRNIRTLFLKGPVLGSELYGDISMRMSSDLDLLIPIDDLNRAEALMAKLGYLKDDYIETVLDDWKWRHHHLTFFHPEKKIKVEIHWRLNPGPAKEPKFAEMWERKRTGKLTDHPIYLLSFEDLFLFLVSHGARHGWSRLRWLVDIRQIMQTKMDWSKSIRFLRKYNYLQVGGQAVLLASQLLKAEIPLELARLSNNNRARRLAAGALFYIKQMVNLHTPPVPKEIEKYHKKHLFSLMSSQQKTMFILSFFYPYPEDAEFFPLPKALHILYFPLRPFLLLSRKMRNQAIARRASN